MSSSRSPGRCSLSPGRVSFNKRRVRSFPRIFGWPSRTLGLATSTQSLLVPISAPTSFASSRSSTMAAEPKAGDTEQLRLRERLTRLRGLPLLRGAGVSGELAKLERQIERIAAEPDADEVWRSVELARHQNR